MKDHVLKYLAPEQLMTLFKLFIYSGVCYNGYGFITDDFNAAAVLLNGESSLSQIVNIFAVTMDTVAWIALLILFELETSVLEDETLRLKRVKWPINTLTAICYIFIIYAFVGYIGKLIMLTSSSPYTLGDVCGLINSKFVVTPTLDEYFTITAENCKSLIPAQLSQITDQPILVENANYGELKILAWVDVINSGTWLMIVILLQMDIILQLKGQLNSQIMKMTAFFKVALYLILFVMAIIWGIYGQPEDFFDAVLWLMGFMIIELNIFNWNQEVEEELAHQQTSHA